MSGNEQVLALPKLSWVDWQAKYRPHIRTSIVWDKLQRPKPKVGRDWIFDGGTLSCVFHPWYRGGNWRDGRPQKVALDRLHSDVLVVAPALLLDRHFLLLDGNHRIRDLRPRVIVLDWIDVRRDKRVYFTDLYNAGFPNEKKVRD